MKNLICIALVGLLLFSCKHNEKEGQSIDDKTVDSIKKLAEENDRKNLIDIKYGEYKEYYPGKQSLKMHGYLNNNNQRTGKWSFYDLQGNELSVLTYEDGKKEGFSVVRYPNGAVHYTGEYVNDKKVGEWKFYDEQGNLTLKNY